MFEFDENDEAMIARVCKRLDPAGLEEVERSRHRFTDEEWSFVLDSIREEIRHQARVAMFASATAAAVERLRIGDLPVGRDAWARWLFESLLSASPIWDDECWGTRVDETAVVQTIAGGLASEGAELIIQDYGSGGDTARMGPFSLN